MNFEEKKVLLVEQDSEIGPLMAYILESIGCSVHLSSLGTCLDDIEHYQPGVVLLDHRQSGTQGASMFVLLSQIHSAHVPVILTSTSNNLQKIAGDCHADDYLAKPFDIHDLEQKVEYWLRTAYDSTRVE
jgi:DNA-binding response OmpR family regulator